MVEMVILPSNSNENRTESNADIEILFFSISGYYEKKTQSSTVVNGIKGAAMIAMPIIAGVLTGGVGGVVAGLFGSALLYKGPTEVRNIKINSLTVVL